MSPELPPRKHGVEIPRHVTEGWEKSKVPVEPPLCPECANGKCGNCDRMAMDERTDSLVPCGHTREGIHR